jgi:hypothetical protein
MTSEPVDAAWDVHVIADSDTRWKWGATLAQRLLPEGPVRVHATLLRGASTPSDRQVRDVGVWADSLRRASVAESLAQLAETDAEVVVLACVGGTVQALLHGLAHAWAGRLTRPVVVTGYVGLVYERVVDGLLLRAGADVVLANSAADAARFRDIFDAVDVDRGSVVQTALPFLGGSRHDPTAAGRTRPFTVSFVTQPGVPETRPERKYALLQVVEHAIRHPERQVIVKLRARVRERTTHVEPYHYTSLLPARQLPANVELVYGPMADVLDRTDLCVTVSSTAALEAMHRDIPTAILVDFGIRESLGNQMFLHSGALTSWDALHGGEIPKADTDWAARNGLRDADPYGAAAARVAELAEGWHLLPPLRPWINPTASAGYLPALLRKHGLDAAGAPLAGAVHPGSDPLPKRALRGVARRAYELGVRTVEPRIKRLAQL